MDILNILKEYSPGESGSVGSAFLSILREELLALRYRQLFHQMQTGGLVDRGYGNARPALGIFQAA